MFWLKSRRNKCLFRRGKFIKLKLNIFILILYDLGVILLSNCFYFCVFYLLFLCHYLAWARYRHFTSSRYWHHHHNFRFPGRLKLWKQHFASSLSESDQSFDLHIHLCRLWVDGSGYSFVSLSLWCRSGFR